MNQRLLAEIGRTQRLEIVNALKRSRGLSVNELVDRMRMSYMGIKQHCLTLQRDDASLRNLIASGLFGDGAAAAVLCGGGREAGGPLALRRTPHTCGIHAPTRIPRVARAVPAQ